MDGEASLEGVETAEGALSGEYYYMKALSYLSESASDAPSDGSLECLHCPAQKDHDDHLGLSFRPGLARDHDTHAPSPTSSSGGRSGGSSPAGPFSASASATSSSSSSSSSHGGASSPKARRERKCSIGGRFYKTSLNSGEFPCRSEARRKLSDGHVHWADEFHKELTRCHPRKGYSRHPSHMAHSVKPILKAAPSDGDSADDC